jgi:hypothetical protein
LCSRDAFLRRIRLPASLCPFPPIQTCEGRTAYRTMNGICNNLYNPYQGSANTAFARILPAAYHDGTSMNIALFFFCHSTLILLGLRRPRSESVLGGPLPGCREISLLMKSDPFYDIAINHHWVIYGQFMSHDITMSLPLSDSGRKSKGSCPCYSRDDDLCNIIPVSPNDPYLIEQQCINTTTTTQAFTNQQCSLGIKEQMNGNTHYIDLSPTYGSTDSDALNLRTGIDGLLKIVQVPWSKLELLPNESEGETCTDGSPSRPCFAAGKSRKCLVVFDHIGCT